MDLSTLFVEKVDKVDIAFILQ